MKKISALIISGAMGMGLAAHAQLINAFNGESLSGYTDTLILDNSDATGGGVSFSDTSGLLATYVGSGANVAEQALFLTPTSLPVGDALVINASVPVSSTLEDLGIAISSTATPPTGDSAGSAGAYSSRNLFDYATVSVRPQQNAVRVNTSISGAVVTANGVLSATPTTVSELFIESIGSDQFTLGYVDTGNVIHNSETVTFGGSSTIGAAIGIYADVRNSGGTSLGTLSDLAIIPNTQVPEPTSLALCGMGLIGTWVAARRKNK